MKQFKAKLLPDFIAMAPRCEGTTVPLILEHNIYGDKLGEVEILPNGYGIISSEHVKVGMALSAGSFIVDRNQHAIREISVTSFPRYPECKILEEI